MDFFERQTQARRRTALFLLLFIVAIAAIILLFYAAMTLVWESGRWVLPGREAWQSGWWWDGELFFWSTVYVVLFVTGGVILRAMALRAGGSAVAELLGGRRSPATGGTLEERQLHNIVEEMAIASGIPKPEVFVLDRERGINAFAAGFTLDDAAVGVTRGAMEALNRDEMQGIIAHEFSHIVNGDMRLNMRMICLLNGILAVHLAGLKLWRPIGGSREWSLLFQGGLLSPMLWAVAFLAFSLMTIGYAGVLFAMIIQRSISRQREYLADASAVQFTRNPSGLAGALHKIQTWSGGSRVWVPFGEEAAHLFFSKALGRSLSSLLDSHPPLEERIQLLDPSYKALAPEEMTPAKDASPTAMETTGSASSHAGSIVQTSTLLAIIGSLQESRLGEGVRLLKQIPASLRDAAGEPASAEAIVASLLLAEDSEEREVQESVWKSAADAAVIKEFDRLAPTVAELDKECRLPLLELALGGLRELSPNQARGFLETLEGAFTGDATDDLFPVIAKRILHRRLSGRRRRRAGNLSMARRLFEEARIVLSSLSHAGTKDSRKAWEAARLRLPEQMQHFDLLPTDSCSSEALDTALSTLENAGSGVKRWLIDAAEFCVASDEYVAHEEAELLRALCAALECPAPPLLAPSELHEQPQAEAKER